MSTIPSTWATRPKTTAPEARGGRNAPRHPGPVVLHAVLITAQAMADLLPGQPLEVIAI